jgi:predicted DNA-binding transcriptional regulator YafY
MYGPSTRLLTILEQLQLRGRVAAADLARLLEVDLRTVRRYVAALQDMGLPIESVRGRHGHYRLRPGKRVPPLILDDEEALAVVIGLGLVRRLGLAIGSRAARSALAKLERTIPEAIRDRVTTVEETVAFNIPHYPTVASGEVMLALGAAIEGRVGVVFAHEGEGDREEVAAEPYGLAYHAGLWYLAARHGRTGATRPFLLDRIADVRPTGEGFARPANFDTLAVVLAGLDSIPGLHRVEVLLRTPYAEAWRQVPPAFAALIETREGTVLRTAVHDLDWLAGVLAGLTCAWTIREPEALRAALRRKVREIARYAAIQD